MGRGGPGRGAMVEPHPPAHPPNPAGQRAGDLRGSKQQRPAAGLAPPPSPGAGWGGWLGAGRSPGPSSSPPSLFPSLPSWRSPPPPPPALSRACQARWLSLWFHFSRPSVSLPPVVEFLTASPLSGPCSNVTSSSSGRLPRTAPAAGTSPRASLSTHRVEFKSLIRGRIPFFSFFLLSSHLQGSRRLTLLNVDKGLKLVATSLTSSLGVSKPVLLAYLPDKQHPRVFALALPCALDSRFSFLPLSQLCCQISAKCHLLVLHWPGTGLQDNSQHGSKSAWAT